MPGQHRKSNYNPTEIYYLPVFITGKSVAMIASHNNIVKKYFNVRIMYDFHIAFITTTQWRHIIAMIIVLWDVFCTSQTINDTYAEIMRTNKMNCTDAETGMCTSGI